LGSELILIDEREQQRQKLDEVKGFLESLQAFNTPGKLKNFTRTIDDIQGPTSPPRPGKAGGGTQRVGPGVDASDSKVRIN